MHNDKTNVIAVDFIKKAEVELTGLIGKAVMLKSTSNQAHEHYFNKRCFITRAERNKLGQIEIAIGTTRSTTETYGWLLDQFEFLS